ncbi:MAG: hypothetical protein ACR2L9_09620 [Solirubrobacteraceae bacterium]
MTLIRSGSGRNAGICRYPVVLLAAAALASYGIAGSASAATAAGAGRTAHCGPAHAPTLVGSRAVRIYLVRKTVYGCAGASGKSYRLGKRGFCRLQSCVGQIALAGQTAAYELDTFGVDTSSSGVVVKNLANGRVLMNRVAIWNVPGPESFESVSSIVVKRDGALAWIAKVSSIGHPSALFEVHRDDGRAHDLLDSGPGIAPRSLRLHGSTMTWTDAGQTRSATLS